MDSIFDEKVILKLFPERAFSGKFLRPEYSAFEIRTSGIRPIHPVGSKIFLHHHTGVPELRIPLTVFEIGQDVHLRSPTKNQWLIALRVQNNFFDLLKKNYKDYI